MRLPKVYVVRRYVITDYADYGLAAPPPGYEWLRYGQDLLEVSPDSGQIMDTVSDAFQESAATAQVDSESFAEGEGLSLGEDQASSADSGSVDNAATPSDNADAGVQALVSGDTGRATELLTRALDSGRLNAAGVERAHLKRGEAFALAHDNDRAVMDLEEARRLNPNDKEAAEMLKQVQDATLAHYLPYSIGALLLGGLAASLGFVGFQGARRRPVQVNASV